MTDMTPEEAVELLGCLDDEILNEFNSDDWLVIRNIKVAALGASKVWRERALRVIQTQRQQAVEECAKNIGSIEYSKGYHVGWKEAEAENATLKQEVEDLRDIREGMEEMLRVYGLKLLAAEESDGE